MGKGFKERIAFEALMILVALALFCLITRLWPLVFLVIPGILIAALRMIFLSGKKKTDGPIPPITLPEPPRHDNEQDVIRIAFGILQRRVTEQVTSRYPSARWVWELPGTMERFATDLPLTILLNRAGGFRKAVVRVRGLQYQCLVYEATDTGRPDEPPPELDDDGDPGDAGESMADETVDYALIAFQWVEANLLDLNNRCNDAIAEGQTAFLIPARDLPHPDSWPEVCVELTRNGFTEAVTQEDGIEVALPK